MGATPSNQRTATNFLLATVIICFFRGLPTIFGKRLYALKFLSFLGYVSHQVTIQGHLIIFLFSNIPHEKSRLFPWKTAQNGTGYLVYFCCAFDALLAFLSIFFPLLDHYAAHVGRQRALMHENPSSRFSANRVSGFSKPPSSWHVDLKLPEETMGRGGREGGSSTQDCTWNTNEVVLIMLAWFCKPRPIRERGMKEKGRAEGRV